MTRAQPARPRTFRRLLRRLYRSTEGAVFAEVVVMLPFFIIVWASVIFVHNYYSSWIRAGAQAKSCAWQYANNACRDIPSGCGAPLTVAAGSDLESGDISGGSALDSFAHSPIINGIVSLVLGKNANVTGSGSVRPPAVLGSTGVGYTVHNAVMCNERPRTPGDLARDAFCGLTRLCH